MRSALTIVSPVREQRRVLAAVRSCSPQHVSLDGNEAEWARIALEFGTGNLVITNLVRQSPGDRFSQLVLSMHNFFRTINTPAQANRDYVISRIAAVQMMLGVTGEPEFAERDVRLDCVWRVVTELDALVFNGNAMLNGRGERLVAKNGEFDTVLRPVPPRPPPAMPA